MDLSLHQMLLGIEGHRNEVSYDPGWRNIKWVCARCPVTMWMPEHILRETYARIAPHPVVTELGWLFLWMEQIWICPNCVEAKPAYDKLMRAAKISGTETGRWPS